MGLSEKLGVEAEAKQLMLEAGCQNLDLQIIETEKCF